MAYMVDTLLRVAEAGGSLVLGAGYMPDSLVRIATTMRGRGGHLTIRAPGLLPDTMVRVSAAAPGQVTFDLS